MSAAPHRVQGDGLQTSIQLLVAEYNWVSGLIRYYREVELRALAGTGLILSGVGAAFTALKAADDHRAEDAIGVVFAIGACITAFLLPVVLMAIARGMRAVFYVREWLYPLAVELSQEPRILAWEPVSGELYKRLAGRPGNALRPVLSAAVAAGLIGAASLALAVAAWTVEQSAWSQRIAAVAAASDLLFMSAAWLLGRQVKRQCEIPQALNIDLDKVAPQRAQSAG